MATVRTAKAPDNDLEEGLISVCPNTGWKRSGLYVPRMACREKESGFRASVLAFFVAVCRKAQCDAGAVG
jgi:hypothetical protein